MKRSIVLSGILAFALVLSVALASVAGASSIRLYRGKTSQGESVAVRLVRTAQGLRLHSFEFDLRLRCEDGTRLLYGVGYVFGRLGYRLQGNHLAFDDASPESAIHVAGTFGPGLASGTVRFTVPALTRDEHAQICTSGDLTWAARHVPIGTPTPGADLQPDRVIHVRADAAGRDGRTLQTG